MREIRLWFVLALTVSLAACGNDDSPATPTATPTMTVAPSFTATVAPSVTATPLPPTATKTLVPSNTVTPTQTAQPAATPSVLSSSQLLAPGPDGVGGAEKGVSIATRAGAQVTAPADGWVVYAGPFRSYGQLLILNAGGGYHILLAGMDRISVDLGQFVLTGEPVAVMGNGSHIAAILATGSSQPVLYIEFRKDGVPVDPGPWWAAGEGEKARG